MEGWWNRDGIDIREWDLVLVKDRKLRSTIEKEIDGGDGEVDLL